MSYYSLQNGSLVSADRCARATLEVTTNWPNAVVAVATIISYANGTLILADLFQRIIERSYISDGSCFFKSYGGYDVLAEVAVCAAQLPDSTHIRYNCRGNKVIDPITRTLLVLNTPRIGDMGKTYVDTRHSTRLCGLTNLYADFKGLLDDFYRAAYAPHRDSVDLPEALQYKPGTLEHMKALVLGFESEILTMATPA